MEDDGDLDRLVDELNASRARRAPERAPRLDAWLDELRQRGGSDLYLVAGLPPAMRIDGSVRRLAEPPLDGDEIEQAVVPVMPSHAAAQYRTRGSADASLRRGDAGRFRINLHRERGRAAASIRALPLHPPQLSELALPPAVEGLTRLSHGLVLVGGPTGSGKTTTVAALVDAVNRRDAKHIITIEDPIEYEHAHARSVVEQVEVGIDTPDFATALRSAVRQSPDVIVVGEMRDPETMDIALAAGETGHLVFSTVHTTDVTSTVSRVSDAFPPERQPTIRQELSMALAAVMTQILIPQPAGGRVPAVELLMVGYGARQHIRKNALQHLHQEITITRRHGSFTLEDCLVTLVQHGALSTEDARTHARHREELDGLLAAQRSAAAPVGREPAR
jgi:twitching motility protein PilT